MGAACERGGIVRRANSCSAKDKGKAYKAREANRHAQREVGDEGWRNSCEHTMYLQPRRARSRLRHSVQTPWLCNGRSFA